VSFSISPVPYFCRFSERNIGRFHTSGISGSMKKFQKIKSRNESSAAEGELNPEIKKLKKQIPEKLQIRQKEIEEDTKQLLELEQKLEEVQFPLFSLPSFSSKFVSRSKHKSV
jgi:hypothetical protein